MPMYDYSKLKGRITEIFGSQREFGKAMKRDDAYVSRYLNGKSQFNQATIQKWIIALLIPFEEVGEYFFCPLG